eukprot:m51a1_g343 putative molybdenum cofactor sulfurase (536) ;mRNA; f:531005-533308
MVTGCPATGHVFVQERLSLATVEQAKQSQAVCVFIRDDCTEPVLKMLNKLGVHLLLLRSGFCEIDKSAAEALGIAVVHVQDLTLEGIADHAARFLAKKNVYLDYTGSGLFQRSQLLDATEEILQNLHGNSHSGSPVSKRTDVELALARETILRFFSASSDEYEVVFTSGATAALKIVGESFPWSARSVFAYTEVNHTSVLGIRKFCASSGGTFRGLTPDTIERALSVEPSGGSPQHGCRDEEAPSHLFAFPGENNFDGEMYPLRWVEAANEGRLGGLWPDRRGKWYTLLDAAAFATTNRLDLSKIHPHFLFGYPTGSGVLLIRRDAGKVLRRPYFGGGTIKCVTAAEGIQLDTPAESLHETLEYGTQSFLSIVALKHGFKRLEALGIDNITRHVHCLTAHLAERLSSLKHSNGRKMVVVHGQHALKDPARQGPIVALSIVDPTGAYVGYSSPSHLMYAKGFAIRCGSMCNPGATQRLFGIGNEMIKALSATNKTCSDDWDLYNGVPLGIIRVSIGYPTTFEDVEVRALRCASQLK